MTEYIALLRGINVGRAKRVPMADLRSLLETLGCTNVRTLLNSGNAVFQTTGSSAHKLAAAIEAAMPERFGFAASVLVHTAAELNTIISENPLTHAATQEPSKFLVAFVASEATLDKAKPLLDKPWNPDQLAIGNKAAYLWCATGILESPLLEAFVRSTGLSVTTRNWATVLKLQNALTKDQNAN